MEKPNDRYPKGQQIWACSSCDSWALDKAKEYIQTEGYTHDDVKIVRQGETLMVVMK